MLSWKMTIGQAYRPKLLRVQIHYNSLIKVEGMIYIYIFDHKLIFFLYGKFMYLVLHPFPSDMRHILRLIEPNVNYRHVLGHTKYYMY